jgi:hypothetical protein
MCPEGAWSTVNDNNNLTLSKRFRTVGMARCTFITPSLQLQAGFLYLFSIAVGIIRQTSCGNILIEFFEDARKQGGVEMMEEKRYTD